MSVLVRIEGLSAGQIEDVLDLYDGDWSMEVIPEGPAPTPAHLMRLPSKDSQRQAFLLAVVKAGARGLTREEAKDELGLTSHADCFSRITELVRGGFLIPSGDTRKTRSGENATVVVATDKARQEMNLTPMHWFPNSVRV